MQRWQSQSRRLLIAASPSRLQARPWQDFETRSSVVSSPHDVQPRQPGQYCPARQGATVAARDSKPGAASAQCRAACARNRGRRLKGASQEMGCRLRALRVASGAGCASACVRHAAEPTEPLPRLCRMNHPFILTKTRLGKINPVLLRQDSAVAKAEQRD